MEMTERVYESKELKGLFCQQAIRTINERLTPQTSYTNSERLLVSKFLGVLARSRHQLINQSAVYLLDDLQQAPAIQKVVNSACHPIFRFQPLHTQPLQSDFSLRLALVSSSCNLHLMPLDFYGRMAPQFCSSQISKASKS